MAATDQYYNNQHTLNVVFAVSSILMLAGTVWMFAADYYRPFKTEQRTFRDVEAALAQRLALQRMPGKSEFDRAKEAVEKAREDRKEKADQIRELQQKINFLLPTRDRAEARYQDVKARLDSRISFLDIATDEYGSDDPRVKEHLQVIADLRAEAEAALAARNGVKNQIREYQQEKGRLEEPLTKAITKLKQVSDQFDTQVAQAIDKQWSIWDSLRAMPILDAFASPIKVQQFTINDIPIDYNFKHVTRFDRCTTCHLGIDRKEYSRDNLRNLWTTSDTEKDNLAAARDRLQERRTALSGLPEANKIPSPDRLRLTELSKSELTESRINQFCNHPRLDLFVGANSPHPQQTFGCTSCHSGQGSATEFALAAHTPNNAQQRRDWIKSHNWESQHMWDFPMQPMRFVESSCLKCHHEITDLITTDNKNEAPKLLRGYEIIREVGCYGCHEINGWKDGVRIGPDLRLEPTPPLTDLSQAERAKLESDPANHPGELRKVGPSLYRLAEKTNPDWVAKWINKPRSFRPDTRMPHFYNVSNNSPEHLPEDQKEFPAAEIHSITHFLFQVSQDYLQEVKERQGDSAAERSKDEELVARLQNGTRLTKEEQEQYDAAKQRIRLRRAHGELKPLLKDYKADPDNGRRMFSEKGCLACHRHEGTTQDGPKLKSGQALPALVSEADYGPNLSQIRAKLGRKVDDRESASLWLQNWIRDPHVHSPRSKMPVVQLTDEEVMDVTAWLLEQKATQLGSEWNEMQVPAPSEDTLYNLAEVYLVRLLSRDTMKKLRDEKIIDEGLVAELPKDEQTLVRNYGDISKVKFYLGKKAVSRQGCFGCHDIPGFDDTKPIGVGLNDWGKKDAARLAFEDIDAWIAEHYRVTDKLVDDKGKPLPVKDESGNYRPAYERFFANALEHRQRDGYLHQKLLQPRSYDYNRLRAWDDRSRMPQFHFSRAVQKPGEAEADFLARQWQEEAEAREAVMTFVLGLVAEKMQQQVVSNPKGDRLAVVKGRKVLETFNCAGCHLVQPGVYNFKLSPDVVTQLDLTDTNQTSNEKFAMDYPFLHHHSWSGVNDPSGETIKAHGIKPKLDLDPFDDTGTKMLVYLQLTEALRYQDKEGNLKSLRAYETIGLPPQSLVYPPQKYAASAEAMETLRSSDRYGAYGGAFADLLTQYLIKLDPASYPSDRGDSNQARASVPPPLIGEGARTQPDWLFNFLLNPQKVRRMTVLQMPRFNLSEQDARALVDYFAAVERLTNPKTDLVYPYFDRPQRVDLDDPYWLSRNAAYLDTLKKSIVKDKSGKELTSKDGEKLTQYQYRLNILQPLWEQVHKDREHQVELVRQKLEAFQAKNKDSKDEDVQKELTALQDEVKRLEQEVKNYTVEKQRDRWLEKEAYVVDAYRLVGMAGSDCLTCHQVGDLQPKGGKGNAQGPPLSLAHQRLRPEWTERWIAHPQRLITYASPMPAYFPRNQKGKFQDRFAGSSQDQVLAARDVLMIYDRVIDMPITRYLALPPTGETQSPAAPEKEAKEKESKEKK